MPDRDRQARIAALVQGAYYVVTGAVPLVSMALFEAITGEKTDDWLVVMVGLLTVAIGLHLVRTIRRRGDPGDVRFLGIASALSFGAMDAWVFWTGAGSAAYLVDLFVELALIALWLGARRSRHPGGAS
jgi:hypothetical protein